MKSFFLTDSGKVRGHKEDSVIIVRNIDDEYLLKNDSDVYFVHSYVICPEDPAVVKASADYGIKVPSLIQSGNVFATQFHPEKSGVMGIQILKNFCEI